MNEHSRFAIRVMSLVSHWKLLANARRMSPGVLIALVLLISGCTTHPRPDWVQAFGYRPADMHRIDLDDAGFPYVPVNIKGADLKLLFDTGNMVGVTVRRELFDQLGLPNDGSWTLRSSAGESVASLRVADVPNVSVFGRAPGPMRVYERDLPGTTGLVGPAVLGDGHFTVHFTMDYGSRMMGVSEAQLPDVVAGFRKIPLVRSSHHPTLILVRGAVENRSVLLELDTGKSRTVVNPALASQLALARGPRGVAIKRLSLGDLSFEVPSAKEVDQTGIDPALPEPILAGVGSDVLSRFVWTVDYKTGVLWIPISQ